MTDQIAKTLALTLFLSQWLASHTALAQPILPDNAYSTAHKKVADNVDPSVMAEVERMKAEQKARSDESRSKFPSATQDNDGVSLFIPPSTPIIVVVETEDGELVATEF